MYIPAGCNTLDKASDPQIRLGIQGFGGTGKTWSATTFNNLIALNIDRGLGAHRGRNDIVEVPIWDMTYCRTLIPSCHPQDIKEVIMKWLDVHGRKLEADQTLLVDGNTGLQNAYHKWYAYNPVMTKQGKIDDFGEWRLKLVWFGEIFEMFKQLKCHVIYLCHETDKKDKSGDYTGKIRPLLRGQMGDEIMGHFTDWFRQHSASKPKDFNTVDGAALAKWGMKSVQEFKAMCDTFPRDTIYFWQLESDDYFDGKCSSLINFPRFIPANYESFKKFQRISTKS